MNTGSRKIIVQDESSPYLGLEKSKELLKKSSPKKFLVVIETKNNIEVKRIDITNKNEREVSRLDAGLCRNMSLEYRTKVVSE